MKKITKLIYVTVLLTVVLFLDFSCKSLDKLTQFNITNNAEVTIPATLGINIPIDIWTPDITTNSTSTFESNNTSKDLIDKIILKELKMEIQTDGMTWDFLKSIELYISAEGLDEKKIAWLDNIPKEGLKTIDLNTSDDDLKEYIKKDTYKLRIKSVTREIISEDVKVKVHSVYFVDAKILGI